ncbi:hypothetical protein DRE_01057 [Drechslerella stenobrocha 248]|uniref:AAA+ ATPase domain-containing protein n=1 Tax=Drechslerella stenobrocha 248 TaxID=1043628 RepID=W7HJU0_9PEZI|nr:hypothetical protein DRE_01057 [Drechslerella stenobrocha 248]
MDQMQSQPPNTSKLLYPSHFGDMSHFTMLEAIVPGHDVVIDMIRYLSGFAFFKWMVGFSTLAIALMSAATYLSYAWHRVMHFASIHFQSTVTVEDGDRIHTHIMTWLSDNISPRNLQAWSKASNNTEQEQRRISEYNSSSKDSKFHLIEWQKFIRPTFEPNRGCHTFNFRGRRLWVRRTKEESPSTNIGYSQVHVSKTEYVSISCWGRSADPIKEFLQVAKSHYLDREFSKTTIFRPTEGHYIRWACISSRPSRPMSTIILEKSQKQVLLKDINDFLHPMSPRWYAKRGIPYRRGYLLHGPPGTGKSSLTYALGGNFGLPICSLSLVEPGLTEERLMGYFGELHPRFILLLEDIDAVEISRERETEVKSKRDNTITLSALLNAIDGVGSHEGRILIMTTNHPEKLDPALTRSGRVDLTIEFKFATKAQFMELFTTMYARDNDGSEEEAEDDEVWNEKLAAAARVFSDKLPDGKFSLAQAQGFLMVRRDDYMKSLSEVEEWRDDLLAKDERKEAKDMEEEAGSQSTALVVSPTEA